MALLGKIRQQMGWLMIVLIVLGLGGFLIMDIVSPKGGGMTTDPYVANIDGIKVHVQELEDAVSLSQNKNTEIARVDAWQQMIYAKIIEGQSAKLGLQVTQKELGELFVGENISSVVRMFFGDPQTGQVNTAILRQNLEAIQSGQLGDVSPEQANEIKKQWNIIFKQVHDQRLREKYTTMVRKAIYTPTWAASKQYARLNQSFIVDYVNIPYTAVSNNEATFTDADLKAYMEANKHKYTNDEATVNFEYVLFDVRPSQEDSALAKTDIDRVVESLKNSQDAAQDSSIVTAESGQIDFEYKTKDALTIPADIAEEVYNTKGGVYGPYFENNAYHAIKVMDIKDLADSVKIRRVFMTATDSLSAQTAQTTLDSLKKAIIDGTATFNDALAFSQDLDTKDKGGEIGFIGKDWAPGANTGVTNFLFNQGKKDSLYLLPAEGGIQLVQITAEKGNGKKGVSLAHFTKAIEASQATIDAARAEASSFATKYGNYEAFKNGVKENQLAAGTAYDIQIDDYFVQGLGQDGEVLALVKWAHKQAEINQTSSIIFELKDANGEINKLALPIVTAKNPKGLASLANEDVRAEVERAVRNEKKAAIIKAALSGNTSLADAAAKYNTTVETGKTIAFNAPFIGNTTEPKVVAVADLLEINKVSAPIASNDGVYLISVNSKIAAPSMPNSVNMSRQISQRVDQAFFNSFAKALKDNASITDSRFKFYN